MSSSVQAIALIVASLALLAVFGWAEKDPPPFHISVQINEINEKSELIRIETGAPPPPLLVPPHAPIPSVSDNAHQPKAISKKGATYSEEEVVNLWQGNEPSAAEKYEKFWGQPPSIKKSITKSIRGYTCLTKPHQHYCATLSSAKLSGIEIDVLGWSGNTSWSGFLAGGWNQVWKKIPQAHSWLNSIEGSDDSIVFYMDGGDTYLTASSKQELIQRFLEWETTKKRSMMFSAESTCFIRTLPNKGCGDQMFDTTKPYPYTNTGIWMGRLGIARWFFKGLLKWIAVEYSNETTRLDDQALIGGALSKITNLQQHIALDNTAAIAQTMWMAWGDLCMADTLVNRISLKKPLFWHTNGNKIFYSGTSKSAHAFRASVISKRGLRHGFPLIQEILNRAPWASKMKENITFNDPIAAMQWNITCREEWLWYSTPVRPSRDYKKIQPCKPPRP